MIIGCMTGCGDKNGTDGVANVTFKHEKVNGGIKITEWEGNNNRISFPENVNGKKVISIAGSENIGGKYYYEASVDYLTESNRTVQIPDSVTEIGNYAFAENAYLDSIELPKNVTEIGAFAFCDCFNFRENNIPDGVEKIENGTFENCYSIEWVKLPDPDHNYTAHVELPNTLMEIGDDAFKNCYHLTWVDLPNVKKIGEGAFSGYSSLKSVTIPGSVQTIEEYTFNECCNLESVEILDGVEAIDYYAFASCSNLNKITIPDSVKAISQYAFNFYTGVTFVVHRGSYAEKFLKEVKDLGIDLKIVYN